MRLNSRYCQAAWSKCVITGSTAMGYSVECTPTDPFQGGSDLCVALHRKWSGERITDSSLWRWRRANLDYLCKGMPLRRRGLWEDAGGSECWVSIAAASLAPDGQNVSHECRALFPAFMENLHGELLRQEGAPSSQGGATCQHRL